jgi:hypothetical protein
MRRLPRPNLGFTVVILAYDRVESLFQIISKVCKISFLRLRIRIQVSVFINMLDPDPDPGVIMSLLGLKGQTEPREPDPQIFWKCWIYTPLLLYNEYGSATLLISYIKVQCLLFLIGTGILLIPTIF